VVFLLCFAEVYMQNDINFLIRYEIGTKQGEKVGTHGGTAGAIKVFLR